MKSYILLLLMLYSIKGQTLGSLPRNIIAEVLSIIIDGTVTVTGNCDDLRETTVNFWLYTQGLNQLVLDPENPSQIDTSKPIVMIIHGWLSDGTTYYIQDIKNAYIENIDEIQVIVVDWSPLSTQDYLTAYCNLPQVAQVVGTFVCNLYANYGLDLSTMHVVGHSLGAQTAGIAGYFTQQHCGSIGRITGLDPAGPLFQGLSDGERLTEDDADFVEVIHSNSGAAGYIGDCGSVDFYPNCGSVQPGCVTQTVLNITSIAGLLEFPIYDLLCDHVRSCTYFTESIGKGLFVGTSCSLCPTVCANDFLNRETLVMGQYTPTTYDKTKYLLFTNAQPPYAKQTRS